MQKQSPVTPQELAQSIASLEMRQQEKSPLPVQTASLEDTIRQLELTVTPEELLSELHAQRTAAHRKAVMMPRNKARSLSWWLLLSGFILSTTTTVVLSFFLYLLSRKYVEVLKDTTARNPAATAQSGSLDTGLRPLTSFAAQATAYVSFSDLQALANGASPSHIQAAQWFNDVSGAQWGVEQQNGRYMVRVNTTRTVSNSADRTEWVTPNGSGVSFNYAELLPVERFKNIKNLQTIRPNAASPNVEQVKVVRGSE